jgi:hypothetical protein
VLLSPVSLLQRLNFISGLQSENCELCSSQEEKGKVSDGKKSGGEWVITGSVVRRGDGAFSSLSKLSSARRISEDRLTNGRLPSSYPPAAAPSLPEPARLVPELAPVWQLPAKRLLDLKLCNAR